MTLARTAGESMRQTGSYTKSKEIRSKSRLAKAIIMIRDTESKKLSVLLRRIERMYVLTPGE